jgi:hypothetical protein
MPDSATERLGSERQHARRAAEAVALLLDRVILGGCFLYSGIDYFVHRRMLTAYARATESPAAEVGPQSAGRRPALGGLPVLARA